MGIRFTTNKKFKERTEAISKFFKLAHSLTTSTVSFQSINTILTITISQESRHYQLHSILQPRFDPQRKKPEAESIVQSEETTENGIAKEDIVSKPSDSKDEAHFLQLDRIDFQLLTQFQDYIQSVHVCCSYKFKSEGQYHPFKGTKY
ncbi:unnamed protein product [Ambrosiozyma monospora]|uniref:Unnamed protein product n=1 Tax=Ambrosiozyma monospora TaxID=43982 RepID=A0ACB5U679_AMBMO|nr:unnamed protein product [Ambrosiozyma monospora]